MTPEAQNIAILEACGWKPRVSFVEERDGKRYWLLAKSPTGDRLFPPNHLEDLNAMHEAEKTFSDVQRRAYAMKVHELTYASRSFGRPENYWICIHATAPQRAEAFLRATGRWKE